MLDAPNISDSSDEVSDHDDTDSVVVHVECEEESEAASHPTIVANSITLIL